MFISKPPQGVFKSMEANGKWTAVDYKQLECLMEWESKVNNWEKESSDGRAHLQCYVEFLRSKPQVRSSWQVKMNEAYLPSQTIVVANVL